MNSVRMWDWIDLTQYKDQLRYHTNMIMDEYDRLTLFTDYYFFIYYSGSYMFRHLCAILRERPVSL
jgi:hypothetical protein